MPAQLAQCPTAVLWGAGNFGDIWTGNLTFPVELKLVTYPEGLRITRTPVAEIASIRANPRSWANQTVTADPASNPLAGIAADTYEVVAEFDTTIATASRFGLKLHTYADGSCNSDVTYDRTQQTLMGISLAPVDGRIKVHVLVDRDQLEVFGNDGKLSSSNNVDFDPALDSRGISVYAQDGSVKLVSLHYNELQRAWPAFIPIANPGSNLAGPWQANGGKWTDITDGNTCSATGDGFYLSSETGTDFTYEADLSLGTAVAAGITFRANASLNQQYTANINTSGGGQIKLWRPGSDLATYSTPITPDRAYHLKVVAEGFRIRVYLGDGTSPVIDIIDTAYSTGLLGLSVYSGTATAQNANATLAPTTGFVTDLAGPWRSLSGAWTATSEGQQGSSNGDGFYLSSQSSADFTYQADLRLDTVGAAALTFRANATATAHYTVNINTDDGASGQVKLWRPGTDLATYATPLSLHQFYHLRVVALGAHIQVYLGDNATPIIDVTDTAYSSGLLGFNVWNGTMTTQNANVS
jgi:fructan beta-fructosidase